MMKIILPFVLFSVLLVFNSCSSDTKTASNQTKVAENTEITIEKAPKKGPRESFYASTVVETEAVSGDLYILDKANSSIAWIGKKLSSSHNGTIGLTSGQIGFTKGKLNGGEFVIDMNSIECSDLSGDQKQNLESHLKGTNSDQADDFFNIHKFPTASFKVRRIIELKNSKNGTHMIYGLLGIKGQEKEVGFKVKMHLQDDGSYTVTSPPFTVDRTHWGIKYGSKTILGDLADNIIDDQFTLELDLLFKPK